MLGNVDSPEWLSTDAIRAYIVFVKDGVSKTIWDELQYQVFFWIMILLKTIKQC